VLCRLDEAVVDCYDQSIGRPSYMTEECGLRSNLIRVKSASKQYIADKRAGRPTEEIFHAFEKPFELAMYLTEKLSLPGELVWDACGCHGNLSLGAMRVGRRVLYTESHPDRYAEGLRRIHREMEGRSRRLPSASVEVKPAPLTCDNEPRRIDFSSAA
jgi:hypothetical protein